jgi:hypothetical protein
MLAVRVSLCVRGGRCAYVRARARTRRHRVHAHTYTHQEIEECVLACMKCFGSDSSKRSVQEDVPCENSPEDVQEVLAMICMPSGFWHFPHMLAHTFTLVKEILTTVYFTHTCTHR